MPYCVHPTGTTGRLMSPFRSLKHYSYTSLPCVCPNWPLPYSNMPCFLDFTNRLAFIHITKSAGTSFTSAYANSFPDAEIVGIRQNLFRHRLLKRMSLRPFNYIQPLSPVPTSDPRQRRVHSELTLLSHHFGTHIPASFLLASIACFEQCETEEVFLKWRFISILRDPFSRLMSFIYYIKNFTSHDLHHALSKQVTLSQCCQALARSRLEGSQTDHLIGLRNHIYSGHPAVAPIAASGHIQSLTIYQKSISTSLEMPHITHFSRNKQNPLVLDISPEEALDLVQWSSDQELFSFCASRELPSWIKLQ